MDWEEFANEFERTCKGGDFAAVAELLRAARNERTVRERGTTPPLTVDALVALLASAPPAEVCEEVRQLLATLLAGADFASILSTYAGYLDAALTSDIAALAHVGMDFVEKALAPGPLQVPSSLRESSLADFLRLLAHRDTGVAVRATSILARSDLIETREEWVFAFLDAAAAEDTAAQCRIAELFAQRERAAHRWTLVARMLHSSDDAAALSALQIVEDACTAPADLASFDSPGLLDRVVSLAQSEDAAAATAPYIVSRAVSLLGSLAAIGGPAVGLWEGRFGMAQMAARMLAPTAPPSYRIAAYSLAASLAGSAAYGDAAIGTVIRGDDFAAPLFHDAGDVGCAALHAAARVFAQCPPGQTVAERQRALYGALCAFRPGGIAETLVARCSSLVDGMQAASYALLAAMLAHEEIARDVVCAPSIVRFLLDRTLDKTIAGQHAKYRIIRVLSESAAVDDALRARLKQYLAQGVAYSPFRGAVAVATQNE